MIKNPAELVIYIRKCEIDIAGLERKKNLYPYKQSYSLLKELLEKQRVLQKRILASITYYKELTKENYIDQVVFGDLIRYIDSGYSEKYDQSATNQFIKESGQNKIL